MTKKINKAAKNLANELINDCTVGLLVVASLEETINLAIKDCLRVISYEEPAPHRSKDFWENIQVAKAAIILARYYSINKYKNKEKRIILLEDSFNKLHGGLDK